MSLMGTRVCTNFCMLMSWHCIGWINLSCLVLSISNIWKQLISILSNLPNFHSLEVVDRVSKTQLQEGENSNWIIWQLKVDSPNSFFVMYTNVMVFKFITKCIISIATPHVQDVLDCSWAYIIYILSLVWCGNTLSILYSIINVWISYIVLLDIYLRYAYSVVLF